MKLILDSCTFIWLCAEPKHLSSVAKKALHENKQGNKHGNKNRKETSLYLSEVSIMEICFKHTSGKLTLPSSPPIWIESQIEFWGLNILPLSRATIYRAGELALHHRDPFDRLIIASALENRAGVVTPDLEFGKYPISVVW